MATSGHITPGLRLVFCLVFACLLFATPACGFVLSSATSSASPSSKTATTTIGIERVRDFHFTPNGGLLINNGSQLRLVDLVTKTTRWAVSVGEGCCSDQVVTERLAAIASGRGEAVDVLDLKTGKLRYRLPADGQVFSSLAVSPDQRLLATGENGQIRVWELADDGLIWEFRNGDRSGWRYAAFDPQGDTLALCDEDGRENRV